VLVAYYCPEVLSSQAERALSAQPEPAISGLTEIEFASALGRKTRMREISRRDAERVLSRFAAHLAENLYRRVPTERRHFDLAFRWLRDLEVPLRALDGLHLAVAAAHELEVITADAPMARAARALGVGVRLLRAS